MAVYEGGGILCLGHTLSLYVVAIKAAYYQYHFNYFIV